MDTYLLTQAGFCSSTPGVGFLTHNHHTHLMHLPDVY